MPEDFYDLLDVNPDASQAELKKAYRAKVREYHPDVNKDERATAQFKTVRRAYEVLSDEKERRIYDRLGHSTYVNRRMGGLPTSGVTQGTKRWKQTQTQTGQATGEGTTGSRSGARGATSAKQTQASTASPGKTTGSGGESGTGYASSRAADADATSRERMHQDTVGPTRTRAGLRNRWVAVVLAAVGYVVGALQYLEPAQASLVTALERLPDAPAEVLAATVGLPPAGEYVQALLDAGVADPGLLFPLGAVALPAVLGWTVWQYGQGMAWLFALATLAPVAGIAISMAVPLATVGGLLAAFVVLPVLGAFAFLTDAGRYLLSTR